jgi:ferredoxin-nitrite reductase
MTPRPQEPQLQVPSWEDVFKRNSVERLKREKFPLDIVEEIPELIRRGYEAIPEEDILRLQWWGLYHDKPKVGDFMLRIKIPGGLLMPSQLRAIGETAERHGRGYGELSTRQNIQLHWIRLDALPAIFDHLRGRGLTTAGGCGDTVRNITGCPVAGISREELFDTQPVLDQAARFFYGNREYSNLPRKHKYTISACPSQCGAPEIHCVGLIGIIEDGREGFAVRVGGGLSVQPRISRDLGVFVPRDDAVEVLRAVTGVWKDNPRYRMSRAKARLKFMVDDYGTVELRRLVEERLGRPLPDGRAPEPSGEADHLGIHHQKQPGFSYVGFPVPLGLMRGEQLVQVADAVQAVGGDIRLTRQQNFIVGNVPDDKLDWLMRAIEGVGFSLATNRLYGVSIGCTGEPFCNFSVTETKGKLGEILERLDAAFGAEVASLKVHLDGCPHACAKHWVGDIGLQGTSARTSSGQRTQAYDIFLRGGLGRRTAIAKQLIRRVPSERVADQVERLVGAWLAEKRGRPAPALSFREFCDAHPDEELRAIAEARVGPGGADDPPDEQGSDDAE